MRCWPTLLSCGFSWGKDFSWYTGVRLRVPGLDAGLRVSAHYATGFDDLVKFFRGLASDWRGWKRRADL